MKGIILAAGSGTRQGASTQGVGVYGRGVSKPLLPVYDKPTIYYPLHDLIAAGVDEVLIITAPQTRRQYQEMFGDGRPLGIKISYAIQDSPKGVAEAFTIGAQFIGDDPVMLTFGDNVLCGEGFQEAARERFDSPTATLFVKRVPDPERFGVATLDGHGYVTELVEKPKQPKSDYAIVGYYMFDNSVVDVAQILYQEYLAKVEEGYKGEFLVTDVLEFYRRQGPLQAIVIEREVPWFDTGNPEALFQAADYVREHQSGTGELIGSPEVAAYRAGRISREELEKLGRHLQKSEYGRMLIAEARRDDKEQVVSNAMRTNSVGQTLLF